MSFTCNFPFITTVSLKVKVLPSHRRVDKCPHVLLRHCWISSLGKDNRAKHREAGFGGLVIPDTSNDIASIVNPRVIRHYKRI